MALLPREPEPERDFLERLDPDFFERLDPEPPPLLLLLLSAIRDLRDHHFLLVWPGFPSAPRSNAASSCQSGCESNGSPTREYCIEMSHEERIADNENWCRHLNERKAEWIKSGRLVAGFRCECWRMDCGTRMPLSGREWQEVRSRANRFAVAPGHIAADVEDVVKEYRHFWIVEKRGEAGGVAEKRG
jgi:hypothetical protein